VHYGLVQTTPPAAEPVSIAEAKAHCRVDITDDDGLIGGLIIAARQYVERFTGRQMVAAVFALTLDWFPGYTAPGMSAYPYGDFYSSDRGWDEKRTIRLRRPPLLSVGSLAYIDTTGTLQTLGTDQYVVDAASEPARLAPAYGKIWPVTRATQNAVIVSFTAGHAHTTIALAISAGAQTVTPGSMAGIAVGTALRVDAGTSQEIIVVTAVTSTTFTATFGLTHAAGAAVTAVPQAMRQAMLLLIGHWYSRREAVAAGAAVELPLAVDALLASYWTGEYGP
jgi:Phage gp6-like head-tail connector protein